MASHYNRKLNITIINCDRSFVVLATVIMIVNYTLQS